MVRVLDSHALLVFLEKEPGHEKIGRLFTSAIERDEAIYMSAVNYGEILYIVLRECGQAKLEQMERILHSLPIEFVPVDLALTRVAAQFKACKKISFADCFAAALAKQRHGDLITGDPEFKALEKEIKIIWIP